MKKTSNAKSMSSELRGSAFFPLNPSEKTIAHDLTSERANVPTNSQSVESHERTDERANDRTNERTNTQHKPPQENSSTPGMFLVPKIPTIRKPERYSFQFWSDQITRLKKLKQLRDLTKSQDEPDLNLSDLVREAIDEYLEKKTKEVIKTSKAFAAE